MPIYIHEAEGRCTSGFALVDKSNNNCFWGGGNGILTSSLCCNGIINCGDPNIDNKVFLVQGKKNTFEQIGVNAFASTDSVSRFGGFQWIDADLSWIEQSLVPYVMGQGQIYPVMGLGTVSLGDTVSIYGSSQGLNFGVLVEVGMQIWTGQDEIGGVNKVDLGEAAGYTWEDLGAPVYTVSNIGDRTVAQALGHISFIDNRDPNHHYVYYTSLDKLLKYWSTITPLPCHYELMVYNETNAKEYDQLLAQVEIPPKN